MKQRKQWLVGILIILIIGIGGAMYMNEKEKAELHEIQTDLANYLYNNYRLYTVDEAKDEQLNKEYNRGEGSLTTEEFLKKSDELKEYSDIKKVEFTSFAVGPMNTLKVYFTINGVYEEEVDLDTISAETEKFIYSITNSTGNGPYYIEKKDKPTKESWQDWKTNFREIGFNDKHQAGAFQAALTYASQIERQYSPEDGYTINTTGHSLGGAEAIYVAALKGYNAITYGAAGSGLTDEQIKNYKGQIINFYDTSDAVTSSFVTGGQGEIPFYSFGVDNYSGVIVGWVKKTFGHDLDMFKTDDAGNYIDKFGDIAVYSDGHGGVAIEQTILAQQILENKNRIRGLETYDGTNPETLAEINRLKKENKWLQEQLKQFNQLNELRVSLTASGGGLSSNERIYLEDSQALAVVKVAASQFDVAMEECLHIYKKVMQELQEDWENGLQLIQRHTPELSYAEMREAMDQVQCTKQTMVDQDLEYFQQKFSKINRIRTSFVQLTQQITAKINELVQRDQELANQLKGALT